MNKTVSWKLLGRPFVAVNFSKKGAVDLVFDILLEIRHEAAKKSCLALFALKTLAVSDNMGNICGEWGLFPQ